MSRIVLLNAIKNKIKTSKTGSIFVAADFTDISDRVKVGVCLNRLDEEGIIKRILRGVYYKPEFNSFLGEYVAPNPDDVAKALARNYGWTVAPCGDTALNMLGLSTQVPTVWSYVSDGPYKEYAYDKTSIKFKHTTNKEISKLSYKTALIIQALKTLGKENIDNAVLKKLAESLSENEKQTILMEAKTATSWIYEYIKLICRS
ncbi:MAG: hypothetical protein IJM37_03225 [Lachnospiraceae bacterium]|nr:hypothetical protein [Lachnospiraceae bacterium]